MHTIIVDSKSGVSGAGRTPKLAAHFPECNENFSAYSVLRHRHVPEVLRVSGLEESEFSFTAQLLPLDRGILETIYFRTARPVTAENILEVYEQRYGRQDAHTQIDEASRHRHSGPGSVKTSHIS